MCLKKLLLLSTAITIIFGGCKPDDTTPSNNKEQINTFTYTLTPNDDNDFPIFLYYQDVNGAGNVPTQVQGGPFKANSTYAGVIKLENEQPSKIIDITNTIKNRADGHQFFFETTLNGLEVAYNDMDENGNYIGLETTLTTGSPGSGTLTVTLLHEPDKTADGVAEGEIRNAGGEIDIELTFDIDVDGPEVITTFSYTLTPDEANAFPIFLYFQDVDRDGSQQPKVQGGPFKANSIYTGTIMLENEQVSPREDVTNEIKNEAAGHQFFFETTVNGLNVDYNDMDENGNPLGLETIFTTGTPGTGTLTITLLHEPDKTANGVADGEINNAGGETDIALTFNIKVE